MQECYEVEEVRSGRMQHPQQCTDVHATSDVSKSMDADKCTPKRDGSMKTEDGTKFTLLQAIGLNTMNMFGTGPLITIPYCLAAVDPQGPHALLGYVVACIACACDSLIWSEIGSMWPKSGGPYVYLRQLYGEDTWGRLVSFMYIWQFFISCPCEAASGFIAVAEYLVYFDQSVLNYELRVAISLSLVLMCGLALYRRIDDIGRVTIVLWTITIAAILYTLIAGFSSWTVDNLKAPSNAFSGGIAKSVMVVSASTRFGVYDMSGYYAVCFMGGMLKNPRRNIPFSCTGTACIVACIFVLCYVAVLGHLDWREFIHAYNDDYAGNPVGIMSLFTESRLGKECAYVVTVLVAITIFGSTFSMLCGQPHVPYVAARDGIFFEVFAHESERYPGVPDVSLFSILGLSAVFCLFTLDVAVDALVTMIVAVMFMGQSVGLMYYRWRVPRHEQAIGWRMPLYPLPCIVQLCIFFFIWITTDSTLLYGSEKPILELSCVFLMLGSVLFGVHAFYNKTWPFDVPHKQDSKTFGGSEVISYVVQKCEQPLHEQVDTQTSQPPEIPETMIRDALGLQTLDHAETDTPTDDNGIEYVESDVTSAKDNSVVALVVATDGTSEEECSEVRI